jgi:hypothetical protein
MKELLNLSPALGVHTASPTRCLTILLQFVSRYGPVGATMIPKASPVTAIFRIQVVNTEVSIRANRSRCSPKSPDVSALRPTEVHPAGRENARGRGALVPTTRERRPEHNADCEHAAPCAFSRPGARFARRTTPSGPPVTCPTMACPPALTWTQRRLPPLQLPASPQASLCPYSGSDESTRGHFANHARICCCSILAAAEYRPCFVTARRIRSIPSAVFGPVLRPP